MRSLPADAEGCPDRGGDIAERKRAESRAPTQAWLEHEEALLDEALGETFPASDPIAINCRNERRPGRAPAGTDPAIACNDAEDRVPAQRTSIQPTIYGEEMTLVERLLPAARQRLVTIPDDAPLIRAAKLLRGGTDLVVVCGREGALTGIITKTDVVSEISDCQGARCMTAASSVMTRNVVVCHPVDLLAQVWSTMRERGLKNIPITDQEGRPVGVLNARDALQVLLQEAQDGESLLRDYVMGVGYR